ncbi:MAG: CRISPR-associated protein Cas4 [Anaerolinea sp.]|nr:CRISPR-associated protein Cas4 [Anaerolinea sp.]
MNQEEYLPISMLNQLEYCERRFYLMHVLGEMDVNVHVLEGTLRHAQAHDAGREREGDLVTHRRVYVWSDELMISGYADVVEEKLDGLGTSAIIPVEYKKGRMGKWLNDHIQLCAQALCLAERSGAVAPKGFIFYFGSRHREEVLFTPELRARTVEAVRRARAIADARRLPPALENYNKCRDCSLEPICLPREVKMLKGEL